MHIAYRHVLSVLAGAALLVAVTGAGCGTEKPTERNDLPLDIHPPAGTSSTLQVASTTGWQAYAVDQGQEQGAELHLEKSGKHVLLPDAAPLGFSPDGAYLLLVWTDAATKVSGLAAIELEKTELPRLYTDASRIPTPGRAADVRWTGHRLEYDLLGEADRLTVGIDLDTGQVSTKTLEDR